MFKSFLLSLLIPALSSDDFNTRKSTTDLLVFINQECNFQAEISKYILDNTPADPEQLRALNYINAEYENIGPQQLKFFWFYEPVVNKSFYKKYSNSFDVEDMMKYNEIWDVYKNIEWQSTIYQFGTDNFQFGAGDEYITYLVRRHGRQKALYLLSLVEKQ